MRFFIYHEPGRILKHSMRKIFDKITENSVISIQYIKINPVETGEQAREPTENCVGWKNVTFELN